MVGEDVEPFHELLEDLGELDRVEGVEGDGGHRDVVSRVGCQRWGWQDRDGPLR
jgi:hypothetical protein